MAGNTATRFALTVTAGVLSTSIAMAEPAAVVEDINHERPDVQFMDMLDHGQTIALSPGEILVLGYLSSCIRETIKGGTVAIGATQSTVTGGSVERTKVACDGGAIATEPAGKREAAAVVFRRPVGTKKPDTRPQHRIHGVSPVIRVDKAVELVRITRLDSSDHPIEVPVSHGIADLSRQGLSLVPGGVYRAESGATSLVFAITPSARADVPLLSRLLRL